MSVDPSRDEQGVSAALVPQQFQTNTTGYEPKHNAPGPPSGLTADQLLDWYLQQHALAKASGASGGVGVPSPTETWPQMGMGALPPMPSSLPFGFAGHPPEPRQPLTPPVMTQTMPIAHGAHPFVGGLFPGISPSAPPGYAAYPNVGALSSYSGYPFGPPPQQPSVLGETTSAVASLLSHGASAAARTASSVLNPMLAALSPAQPSLLYAPTPQYFTPVQEAPTPPTLTQEMLQELTARAAQTQVPADSVEAPADSVAGRSDSPVDAAVPSVPLDVVLKLIEMLKIQAVPQQSHGSVSFKEADRVVIPNLPVHIEYTQWRYSVSANIMSASSSPHLVGPFWMRLIIRRFPIRSCILEDLRPLPLWMLRSFLQL